MYQKIFLSLLMIFFSQTLWADSTSNIIVNGDFSTQDDWGESVAAFSGNWSIVEGKAYADGTGSGYKMFENNSTTKLLKNKTYRITFDIVACSDFEKVGFFIQSTHPESVGNGELYFSKMGITTTGRHSVELTLFDSTYYFRLLTNGATGTTAEIDNISVVEIPDYTITPKEFLFGSESGEVDFNITNTGAEIDLGTVTMQTSQAEFFTIGEACNGKSLATNESCIFTVSYFPPTDRSISAYLNIDNVTAFLHNYESIAEEAARRLPPVIDDINISEVMDTGTDYNLTWSIVGYGDDYTTYIAFFDCNNTTEGSCGESYGSTQRFDQGLNLTPSLTENAGWTYQGEEAKRYHYNYHFTALADEFGSGDTPIVIRFYYVDSKDLASGQGSISLIIPGNLSENYYDTSGRKIQKIIHKP